jgi:hypothetical protein
VGRNVEVRGFVVSVATSPLGTTFIIFGREYANQTFEGFVAAGSKIATDEWIDMLQGKIISITGIIELYQGKPENRHIVKPLRNGVVSFRVMISTNEKSCGRKDPLLDQHEERFTICVRRIVGDWKDPANGERLHTCTIITGEPRTGGVEIFAGTSMGKPPGVAYGSSLDSAGMELPLPARKTPTLEGKS